MLSLLKKPSAWIPLALPLFFVAVILVRLITLGPPGREQDEGTMAHLFQLWLLSEPFLLAFFALKWVPQRPKPALAILALQILAALAACFPVFYFEL